MKYLAFLVLLFTARMGIAQSGNVTFSGNVLLSGNLGTTPTSGGGGGGGGGGSTINCDIWEDFEFAAPIDTTKLGNQDHGTITWAVSDGSSLLSISASGENHTINKPQGSTDSGSSGMSCSVQNALAFIQAQPSSTTISAACWVYCPALSADDSWYFFAMTDSGSVLKTYFRWKRLSGSYSVLAGANSEQTVASSLTANAWYWFTMKYVASGTCSYRMYDASGNAVGSLVTDTDSSGSTIAKVRIGTVTTQPATGTGTAYFDDLLINTSTADFPLGP